MSTPAEARQFLRSSLTKRSSTSEVAQAILDLGVLEELNAAGLLRELNLLAKQNLSWSWNAYMNGDYDLVDPADTQLETFSIVFPDISLVDVDSADPAHLHQLVRRALDALGVNARSAKEAVQNRLNYDWQNGIALSKKNFTKRLRFLNDFEEKTLRVQDTLDLRHAQMQAKSRLAYTVDTKFTDDLSLSFIAYLAARANRRSLFMLGGQSKAFDSITDGLQKLLGDDAAWDEIALVMPVPSVFKRLTAERRGELVGIFHREMSVAAAHLGQLWPNLPERMRDEMVMVRDVDSSRWNAFAGALNTMRSAWISVTIASGLETIFESYLPGKTPRLMASDIVWWARSNGEDLHEDTRMFGALPKAWDVVAGREELGRQRIEDVAASLSIEAEGSGWVGPRAPVAAEMPEAEPATVHGVVIADPALAVILRKHGVFSGGAVRDISSLEGIVRAEIETEDGKKIPYVVGKL